MGILPLKNKPERSNFHLIPKLPPQASLAVQRNHRSIESYRRRELHHHRHTQRFIVSECLPPWLLFLDPTVFIASICDSPAISANVEPSGFEIIPLHHYTAIKHVSTTPRHGLFFFRTFGVVWGQAPRLGRRSYVTAQPHEAEKGSDLPWLIGSLALGVPLVTYLMQTGPEKKVHYGHFRPEVREALEKGHPIQSVDLEKPSAIDPVLFWF
ncbi:hypothetical protein MAP00_007209 [Monascus purpureus]|nr:hypothetical protein MAP00_007209 [Monascus purpureus]